MTAGATSSRSYGVPVAAYDGSSTTGLSADERTLVLSEVSNDYPPKRSRMVVLNPFDLRPRSRLSLPGAYTVHALSPDGRFIYLIRYPEPIRDIDRHELTVYDLENPGAPELDRGARSARRSRVSSATAGSTRCTARTSRSSARSTPRDRTVEAHLAATGWFRG